MYNKMESINDISDVCITIIFSYFKFSNFLTYIRLVSKKFNNFGRIPFKTYLTFKNVNDIFDNATKLKKMKIKNELATLNINVCKISQSHLKYIPKNVLSKISSLSTNITKGKKNNKKNDLIKKLMPPIKELSIFHLGYNETNLDIQMCNFILTFPTLELLHIDSCIERNLLKSIFKSNLKLKHISIAGKSFNKPNYCGLYGNDLKYLIGMPLESILLSYCIFDESFDVMKSFNINELKLYQCECNKWDKNHIYSNIESLDFTPNDYNQIELLKQFTPKKLYLRVDYANFDDFYLIQNIKHMQLEVLFLSFETFRDVKMFVGMPLKFLGLESRMLQDQDLECLSEFPLKSVQFVAPKLEGKFFEYLQSITTLKYLNVYELNNTASNYLHFLNKTRITNLIIEFKNFLVDISSVNLEKFDGVHIFSNRFVKIKVDKCKTKW